MKYFLFCFLFVAFVGATFFNACVRQGQFAFTFDDGPSENIPQLLQMLAKANVKASFHFVRRYIVSAEKVSLVQQCIDAGHVVGLRLSGIQSDSLGALVTTLRDSITFFSQNYNGYKLHFIRLDYGAASGNILIAAQRCGLVITEQNLDSQDYATGATATTIWQNFNFALQSVSPGTYSFIASQHDAIGGTVEVLPRLISLVQGRQYSIVTLSVCVAGGDGESSQPPAIGNSAAPSSPPLTESPDPFATGAGNAKKGAACLIWLLLFILF